MRIFSGHDYYDTALAYGIDSQISFVRTEKFYSQTDTPLVETSMPRLFLKSIHSKYGWHNYDDSFTFSFPSGSKSQTSFKKMTVYFAGKRYVGLVAFAFNLNLNSNISRHSESIWSYDSLVNWANANELSLNPDVTEAYFQPRDAYPKELEWLIKEKIAIAHFVDRDHYETVEGYVRRVRDSLHPWICNSASAEHCLKKYGFFKALDPYTAMQELSMFIGGVLGNTEPNMVQITDEKTLVAKHGFDKWSFRTKSKNSKE